MLTGFRMQHAISPMQHREAVEACGWVPEPSCVVCVRAILCRVCPSPTSWPLCSFARAPLWLLSVSGCRLSFGLTENRMKSHLSVIAPLSLR